jgi:predicted  nucleic acid-binding Zn-ribbon protein
MSVEFSNTYQEILLENLVSIIKQNFIFQTQLKMTEGAGKEKTELQEKYDTLLTQYNSLTSQTSELEALRSRVDTNASAHEEKSRIQSALNDEMKKSVELRGQLEAKSFELSKKNAELEAKSSELAGKNAELEAKSSELAGKIQEIVDMKNQMLKIETSIPTSKSKKSNPVSEPIESTPLIPTSSKGKDGNTF